MLARCVAMAVAALVQLDWLARQHGRVIGLPKQAPACTRRARAMSLCRSSPPARRERPVGHALVRPRPREQH